MMKGLEEAPVAGKNLSAAMLQEGFAPEEVGAVFNENALRFLRNNLPTITSVYLPYNANAIPWK